MTTAATAASMTTQIRKILGAEPSGKVTSYQPQTLHGEPRVIKKRGNQVKFTLSGRTFLATISAWNARGMGYIEATEI